LQASQGGGKCFQQELAPEARAASDANALKGRLLRSSSELALVLVSVANSLREGSPRALLFPLTLILARLHCAKLEPGLRYCDRSRLSADGVPSFLDDKIAGEIFMKSFVAPGAALGPLPNNLAGPVSIRGRL
jgi:hypothetical protein